MKIKSSINVTDINRHILISILKRKNYEVTGQKYLKFESIVQTYAGRGFHGFNPTIIGEYNFEKWNIKINSVLFKSLLFSITGYIFFWVNEAELTTRIIASIVIFFSNLKVNTSIIKTRIENIESEFRKRELE